MFVGSISWFPFVSLNCQNEVGSGFPKLDDFFLQYMTCFDQVYIKLCYSIALLVALLFQFYKSGLMGLSDFMFFLALNAMPCYVIL